MSKQNEIPTTSHVGPYSRVRGEFPVWAESVAGFCKGAQTIKQRNGLLSLRIGSLVHVQGFITVENNETLDELPVAPRQTGFILMFDDSGDTIGREVIKKSKQIDVLGLPDGNYYISGNYIADFNRGN